MQYIGESGRSLHARAAEHMAYVRRRDKKGVLYKHIVDTHANESTPQFTMRVISSHKSNLSRMIAEGIHIEKGRISTSGGILNSKAEWGRGKQVRFTPGITRH